MAGHQTLPPRYHKTRCHRRRFSPLGIWMASEMPGLHQSWETCVIHTIFLYMICKKIEYLFVETFNQHNSQVGTAFVQNGCTKRVLQFHHHYNQSSVKINLGWTYVALLFPWGNFDDLPFNGGWNFQQETALMQHVSQLFIWSLGAIKQVAVQKNLLSQAQNELLCTGTSSKDFKFKDFNSFSSYVALIFWAHHEPCKFCPNIRSPFGFLPMKKQPEHRKTGESQALSTALHVMTLTVRQWGRAKHVVPQSKMITLPETNSSALKKGHPKRKFIFQPPIFRCYVGLREGSFTEPSKTKIAPTMKPWNLICQHASC